MTVLAVTKAACENIHRNVLRVLAEIGLKVEHDGLLDALAGLGAHIDRAGRLARFPPSVVEGFLAAVPKVDWETRAPSLTVRASFYHGRELDPHSGALHAMTPERIERYLRVARSLPHVNATLVTGCPWGASPALEPLYERYYCWKFGAEPSAILYPLEQAPRLLALYEAYAQLKRRSVKEVFQGGVFLQSPLRLSAEEAAQFAWWWSRGFQVSIAVMTTAGLTGPVTPAGVVTMHLAENLAVGLLQYACYGEPAFGLMAMLAPMDMRTMRRPYGRVEMAAGNRLFAAMARHYGLSCFLHSGVADVARPSFEAGCQKTMLTLGALQAGADAMIDAGLLCGDCVYSPIQLILDNELAGVIKRLLRPYDCSDDAIGFEAMAEAGPGGLFTDLAHTAERFRAELWEPTVWTRDPRPDDPGDVGRALDLYDRILATAPPLNCLTPDEDAALRRVIGGP